ncbi:hypothetical protein Q3G72_015112 [Acer saccharum]|nr:hypothetical protein Q3G72_015112 [Acer saccharum]
MNKCGKTREVGADVSRFSGLPKLKREKVVGKKAVKDEGSRKSNDRSGLILKGDTDTNDSFHPSTSGSKGEIRPTDIEDGGSGYDAQECRELGDNLEAMENPNITGNSSTVSDVLSGLVSIFGVGFDQQKRRGGEDLVRRVGSVDKGLVVVSPAMLFVAFRDYWSMVYGGFV